MAAGTLIRVAAAVLSGAIGAAGLWRSTGKAGKLSDVSVVAGRLRMLCLLACAVFAVMWLVIAALRYRYPYELEWIGGGMLDHCLRVIHGQPLYVPPGSGWFPYEYQPVYFWISAILMKWTHDTSFGSMRLVSIASTLGSTALLFAWTRSLISRPNPETPGKLTASWAAIAAGIFLASYRFTGAWYDAERLDMLFLLFTLAGGFLLNCAEDARSRPMQKGRQQIWQLTSFEYTLLSGISFALAFFTKQMGVLFILGCMAALMYLRSKANLATFSLVTVGLGITGVYVLNHATHNWYSYYCFRVPLSNGIRLNLLAQFFFSDMALYAPLIAILTVGIRSARTRKRTDEPALRHDRVAHTGDAIFVAMVMAALATSVLSRAHWGGAENVLIPAYALTAAAACAAAGRWERRDEVTGAWLYLLCASQLIVVAYRPDLQVPKAANYQAGEAYTSLISGLQREGEVLCLEHGALTSKPHFQIMALIDVVGTEKRLPEAIQTALNLHRYAAVVMDAPPETTGYLAAITRAYPNVTRIGITGSWVVTGFLTPSPTRAVYVLRR